ncbi:hypothetical protein BLOT_007745 [Blomia tropicalis]|nr:hypothetical protein BLOT_007745 [Blomia tropicalis]
MDNVRTFIVLDGEDLPNAKTGKRTNRQDCFDVSPLLSHLSDNFASIQSYNTMVSSGVCHHRLWHHVIH